jgi:hypothetical protein
VIVALAHAVLYVVVLVPLINSVGHWRGAQNFKKTAYNSSMLAWVTGGESLHNNHHADPRAPKLSVRLVEVDPSWLVIRVLVAVRLVASSARCAFPPSAEHCGERWPMAVRCQGFDLQLTRYDERGWRATFYMTGMEHSPTSATGTACEAAPWRAVQGAARDALRRADGPKPKTEKKAAIAAPVSRVLPMDLQLGDRLVDERGEWRVSDEDVSPGWAARLRRLAAHELLGAASASGWAPVFHGESREDLRPVFLPVARDDEHALGDDAGLEDGPSRRDQLRAVTQGYRRPGRIDILDSTLDRLRRFRGRRRRAGGRRAPPSRWRELRLGERRGDKDRRGQHRDEHRERVHVSPLM